MHVIEAIRSRKSIRQFKPDPVPKVVLEEILEVSCQAPSAVNSQPWEFVVLGGAMLEKVRQANLEELRSGREPRSENPLISWPRDSVYRQRQVALATHLFELMGIERDDKEKRTQWMERGFRYFDAPAAIIVVADRSLGDSEPLLDLGCVTQTLCLAALAHGLGTCIEDQGVMYPDVLRQIAGIPEQKKIVIAIAVGYPDPDFPANTIETAREPLEKNTTWLGFG